MATFITFLFAALILVPGTVVAAEWSVDGRTLTYTDNAGASTSLELSRPGRALFVHEDRAYVAAGPYGALIIDISVPTSAGETGRVDLGGVVTGFFLLEDSVWARIERVEAKPVGFGHGAPVSGGTDRGHVPGSSDDASGPRVGSRPNDEPPTGELPTGELPTGELPTGEPPTGELPTGEPRPDEAPADETPAATPGAVGLPSSPRAGGSSSAVADVLEFRRDAVVIGLGSEDGIERGQNIEVFLPLTVDVGGGEFGVEERMIMVGKVRAVSPNRSEVKLGVNERVPRGSRARPTSKPVTSNRILPPRVGGIWEFGITARPFLALGTFGFGTVSDATARRRFEDTWSVELRLDPLSFGVADEGNVAAVAGNVIGSYDTRLFSVGLGLGGAIINEDVREYPFDPLGSDSTRVDEVNFGFSIAQAARLGSRDGLHLSVYNTFLQYNDQFNYGGTIGGLQFSVADGLWVIARGGGGGPTGYGFGEIGLRVLIRGSGDRGSLYLSPTVGGGGLSRDDRCDRFEECTGDISYGGPLIGLGLEWRE